MARYFPRRRSRRPRRAGRLTGRRGRTRRWIYIISALLAVAACVVFAYVYLGKNQDKTPGMSGDTSMEEAVKPSGAEAPRLIVEPGVSERSRPTAEPNARVAELIDKAMGFINASPAKIIDAREILNGALAMPMNSRQRMLIKEHLSELADKWLFSRTIYPQDRLCGTYKVKTGDQLRTIGEQYRVPHEILMDINKLPRAQALRAGEPIKVINGPFHAKIYRSTFTMDLYLQNTFVRSFTVGLGQPGMETPTGLWCVKEGGKLERPVWTDRLSGRTYQPTDPDYPLGSRWIALEGLEGEAKDRTGFAIHGTKDPDQIGTADSQGCIRLNNGDAILIYKLLVPTRSLVKVVE